MSSMEEKLKIVKKSGAMKKGGTWPAHKLAKHEALESKRSEKKEHKAK